VRANLIAHNKGGGAPAAAAAKRRAGGSGKGLKAVLSDSDFPSAHGSAPNSTGSGSGRSGGGNQNPNPSPNPVPAVSWAKLAGSGGR
jgi:hypothetical protein